MPWHRRCSGARVTFGLDSSVVPGDVAPEWLYRRGWPILRHRIGHDSLQRKPHSGRIIVKREQRGLVQDRSTRRVGVANQQTQRENRPLLVPNAAAGPAPSAASSAAASSACSSGKVVRQPPGAGLRPQPRRS
jgi:hypothetical protein